MNKLTINMEAQDRTVYWELDDTDMAAILTTLVQWYGPAQED
jgi:hypothetical protein